jgi:hypothetical protein
VDPREGVLRQAIDAIDVDAAIASYQKDGQLLVLERFLPDDVVRDMVGEARALMPRRHRTFLPFVRKAGTIGQPLIKRAAPWLYGLYQSPAFLELASRVSGEQLAVKNDVDAHACALYTYQRAGDHVGWHYDVCGCEEATSYTATLGLINDTRSQVHFQLHRKEPGRTVVDRWVRMTPGSLVFFCGSKVYHRVTPLAAGEERVVYSFTFVREGKRLRGWKRFVENIKDAILYFGPRAIVQRNYR